MRSARLAWAIVAVLCACQGTRSDDDDEAPRHFSWRRVRVLMTEGAVGPLRMFDAEDEIVTHTFVPDAPVVGLAPSFTGDNAFVATAAGVRLVRSGVSIWEHIDHVHVYKSEPALAAERLGDSAPGRVASNGSYAVLGWNGEAPATLLVDERKPEAAVARAGDGRGSFVLVDAMAQHGVVDLTGTTMVVESVGSPSPTSPVTRSLEGCSSVVAGAAAGDRLVLACAEGMVETAMAEAAPLQMPSATAAEARAVLLHPHAATAVLRLSAGEAATFTAGALSRWQLPRGACDVALDPTAGAHVVVLAADGSVAVLDLAGQRRLVVQGVVAPFDCASAARPHLGLAPERAYVTDPNGGALVDVDLARGRVARRHLVSGAPTGLAVLGLDPRNAGWRGARPGEP